MASVRNAAEERGRSLEYASSVLTASLVPIISDQEPDRIAAELQLIKSTAEAFDIECIEIEDSAGVLIAESNNGCSCEDVESKTGMFAVFTEPQVVRVPVDVEGLHLATVSIQFMPIGLEHALYEPLIAISIVLALAMVVFGLWGGWMMLHTVVEPIGELIEAGVKIVDMSGDFRIRDVASYERYYKTTHPCPELLSEFVYGLPELNRETIAGAQYVASPGCFATAIELA